MTEGAARCPAPFRFGRIAGLLNHFFNAARARIHSPKARSILTGMLIGMLLRSVLVVLGGVQRMAVRDFGMVSCFFMMPGRRMSGGFLVVPRRMFVMFSSFLVVFVNCVLFHDDLPGCTILDTLRNSIHVTMKRM
jgi:hypothetical protein